MAMADYMESNVIQLMQESPFLGIMIDESTDLSVRKNLIIYINLLMNGRLESFFVHINELKKCDADSLTRAIAPYFEENDVSIAKVVGLESDRASVMVGRYNGFGAKLKKQNPIMLSMHCVTHKLALASQSAAASVPYCNEHHSILKGVYNYFHTSSVHYSALREVMVVLNDPVMQIQQVHSIRWLTMHKAV